MGHSWPVGGGGEFTLDLNASSGVLYLGLKLNGVFKTVAKTLSFVKTSRSNSSFGRLEIYQDPGPSVVRHPRSVKFNAVAARVSDATSIGHTIVTL